MRLLMSFLLFMYLLVAIRIALFQVQVLIQIYYLNERGYLLSKNKTIMVAIQGKIAIISYILRMIKAILLWPIDFIKVPTLFLQAYVLFKSAALAQLALYYVKTRFFWK